MRRFFVLPLFVGACPPPSTATTVLLSGEVLCDECGVVVVAAFASEALDGAAVVDVRLTQPGPFELRLDRNAGQTWLLAFADDNNNRAPDPGEASVVRGPFDLQTDDVVGVALNLDEGPGCGAYQPNAELSTTGVLSIDVLVDASVAEWPVDHAVVDPPGASDPCDEPSDGGGDLLGWTAAEGVDVAAFHLQLASAPGPDQRFVIELRRSSTSELPGLRIEGTSAGGEVQFMSDPPETRGPAIVASAGSSIEVAIPLALVNTLEGWRVQVSTSGPEGFDRSAYAQLSNQAGTAADDGAVYDVQRVDVVLADGVERAAFDAVAAAVGLDVESFDPDLSVGVLATGLTSVSEARALAEEVAAESGVEAAGVRVAGSAPAGVSWNDLHQLGVGVLPAANWAMLQIEATDAQEVVWDCTYRLPESRTVQVAVLDNDIASGLTEFSSSSRYDWTTPGATSATSVSSHGMAVASLIGKGSAADPRSDATVKDRGGQRYSADRLSGLLAFKGDDGWSMPYNLQLHNMGTRDGARGVASYQALRQVSDTRPAVHVLNNSWSYLKLDSYCKNEAVCAIDGDGKCVCSDLEHVAPMMRCEGRVRGNADAAWNASSQALGRTVSYLDRAASGDPLLTFSAGNDCRSLDSEFSSTSALGLSFGRALVVGASNRDMERAWFSNYGRVVTLYAPGQEVLVWKPGHDRDGDRYDLKQPTRVRSDNGTSYSAPIVAGVAGLVRWIDPDLTAVRTKELLIGTGVAGGASLGGVPVVNASRAATRAILDRIDAGGHDVIVSLQTADFKASCATGPSEGALAENMVVGCATFDRDSGEGGGQAFSKDPELYHALDVTWVDDSVVFTLEGTDFSPGPGPSKTTFTATAHRANDDIVSGGSVYILNGTLDGGVVLRDPEGKVTDDCAWSGTFAGRLYTTAD